MCRWQYMSLKSLVAQLQPELAPTLHSTDLPIQQCLKRTFLTTLSYVYLPSVWWTHPFLHLLLLMLHPCFTPAFRTQLQTKASICTWSSSWCTGLLQLWLPCCWHACAVQQIEGKCSTQSCELQWEKRKKDKKWVTNRSCTITNE